MRSYAKRDCETCGTTFQPTGSRERWCSAICSVWAHTQRRGKYACWSMPNKAAPNGYIVMTARGRGFYAHVLICEWWHGPIPPGMYATHACDNRWCVNPRHIRPSTPSANFKEAIDRGRRAHTNYAAGDRHPRRIRALARRAEI